jgi:hypothetical protein
VGWGVVNPLAALATVIPEEGTGPGKVRAIPQEGSAVSRPVDHTGGMLLLVCFGGAVLLGGLAALMALLGPKGHRRRWRPARVLKIAASRESAFRATVSAVSREKQQ